MALFADVASLAEQMAGEASRLKKRAAIAAAIGRVAAESVDEAGLFAMYLAGEPFAEADPRKLNAGGALLTRAVMTVSAASDAELRVAYRRHGDLGAAAYDLLTGNAQARSEANVQGDATLTLPELADAFAAMAVARSTAVRSGLVEGLLRRATALEAKYLLKLMLGDMRIGVKQSLVEEAIAVAATADVAAVRHAVMLEADLAGAVRRAFAETLGDARMQLFHPLGFMLASPVETAEEAVARFTEKPAKLALKVGKRRGKAALDLLEEAFEAEMEDSGRAETTEGPSTALPFAQDDPRPVEAFLEDKFDGMRAQLHCGDRRQPGRVAIYSRNREDVTQSFPELAEAFARVTGEGYELDGLVFDGEILGWDLEAARALPFAVLGQRIGRKKVSNEWRRQVPVVFMAFDLMVGGGEPLLPLPLRQRRLWLEAVVGAVADRVVSPVEVDEHAGGAQGMMFAGGGLVGEPAARGVPRLMLSASRLVGSAEDIDRAYTEARARSNEGVMLKAAESPYLPGRRGIWWVKLKRELATLDVVITGAEFGSGRRAPFLSDYTFAVRGPDYARTGELLNVGKAYSGVTDVEIAELTEFLKAHTLEDFGHFRTVEPLVILEVAFNNIMRSDRHASGFALRFPRILRIRTDKPLAEIDTVERVEEVYQSQVDKPVEG